MTDAATALIGLDWGTSSLRAYRLALDGRILDSRTSRQGILDVPAGRFEAVFLEAVSDWLDACGPGVPVVASGMVGSRQGWVEAPYVPCPASLGDLGRGLVRHRAGDAGEVHFVPGVCSRNRDHVPDVMRGEETQIFGAIGGIGATRLVVLPGTHSKWARVEDGRIAWFSTFMTGELFALLTEHGILGRLMRGEQHDASAFARGLAYAGSAGLLGKLFSARTLGLFDEVPGECLRAYLSGLLIGSEMSEALAMGEDASEVTIIGRTELAQRYLFALRQRGIAATTAPENVVVEGHRRIAAAAGLLPLASAG